MDAIFGTNGSFNEISWLWYCVSVAVAFGIGAIWYTLLFGKQWIKGDAFSGYWNSSYRNYVLHPHSCLFVAFRHCMCRICRMDKVNAQVSDCRLETLHNSYPDRCRVFCCGFCNFYSFQLYLGFTYFEHSP